VLANVAADQHSCAYIRVSECPFVDNFRIDQPTLLAGDLNKAGITACFRSAMASAKSARFRHAWNTLFESTFESETIVAELPNTTGWRWCPSPGFLQEASGVSSVLPYVRPPAAARGTSRPTAPPTSRCPRAAIDLTSNDGLPGRSGGSACGRRPEQHHENTTSKATDTRSHSTGLCKHTHSRC